MALADQTGACIFFLESVLYSEVQDFSSLSAVSVEGPMRISWVWASVVGGVLSLGSLLLYRKPEASLLMSRGRRYLISQLFLLET